MVDPQRELEHLRKLATAESARRFGIGNTIPKAGTTVPQRRRYIAGEPDAAMSCLSGSEGAGRKRAAAMRYRAVLRPYLNDFCQRITQRTPCRIIVYADDFVIMHRQSYTQAQLDWFVKELAAEGLTINPDKTRVVDMTLSGAAFEFLGFSLKRVRGYYGGKEFIKIQPSKASMAQFKEKIRDIVKHRTSLTLAQLIARVNPIIRGWRNYFAGVGYPRAVFFKLDWFVCARFYRWSRRLSQRAGKRLAQNAWEVLRKAGLQFLQPLAGVRL